MKIAKLKIEYCNSKCPNFYHKYSDSENIYCSELNEKIYDNDCDDILFDFKHRGFPSNCPLEDEL
jgi:hypothetical protein